MNLESKQITIQIVFFRLRSGVKSDQIYRNYDRDHEKQLYWNWDQKYLGSHISAAAQ